MGKEAELLYVIGEAPVLSATKVTEEPFRLTPLAIAISVPVVAVPVKDNAPVALKLLLIVIEVPVNDIEATDDADEDVFIAPPLVTATFKPEANVPSVNALVPAL